MDPFHVSIGVIMDKNLTIPVHVRRSHLQPLNQH